MRECEACGAEQGEPCRPSCIGEAVELERIQMQVNEDRAPAEQGVTLAPYGCGVCGRVARGHGDIYTPPVGGHLWVAPSLAVVKRRMMNRRNNRS